MWTHTEPSQCDIYIIIARTIIQVHVMEQFILKLKLQFIKQEL